MSTVLEVILGAVVFLSLIFGEGDGFGMLTGRDSHRHSLYME